MTFFNKVHVLIITHQNRVRSIFLEFLENRRGRNSCKTYSWGCIWTSFDKVSFLIFEKVLKHRVWIFENQNRVRSIFLLCYKKFAVSSSFFFKCTWGTELSVKTSRTAPNCTRTARPISTNYQSTLQCFHKKCTKCTKCTRGTDLSVKTSQTAPNCTRTARLISTKFQST